MAIAIDSEMPTNTGVNRVHDGGTTWTWSFTNTAGTLVILGVSAAEVSAAGASITSATYGGQAMTSKVSLADGGGDAEVELFYLQNPPTGANNFVVTVAGGFSSNGQNIGGAISLTGAKTGDPFLSTNTGSASSTSVTVNLSSVQSSSLVISLDAMGSSHAATPGNRTKSWQADVDTQTAGNNAYFQRATGLSGTVAMTANCSGTDAILMVAGEIGTASSDVSTAVSGSAVTGGAGTNAPGISVPL